MEHVALETAGILHAHHGQRDEIFVDARRGEGVGGADFAAVFTHGLRALRTVDAKTGGEGLGIGKHVIADPGERKISDDLFVGPEAVETVAVDRRDDEIVEREHHALGSSGRAGGVEHDGEILASPGGNSGFPALQAAGASAEAIAADLLHIVDPFEPLVVVVAQPARLVVDNEHKARQTLDDGQELVDLLLVLDHRDRHLGMVEDVGHLLGDGVRVDRHRHAAERLRGAHCPVQARPVRANDGNLVVPREPELLQTDGKGAYFVEHLRPGPHLPNAEILVPIGGTTRKQAGVAHQQLGEGIRAHGFGHPPFTASSPAGRQALAAVCRQIVVAHKKMRSSPGQVGTWYQTG